MQHNNFTFFILLSLCAMLACSSLNVHAEEPVDTNKVYELHEVVLTEHNKNPLLRSTTPQQTLTDERLKNLNALQLSDGIKSLSGVTVKDYGGIGGLKTVSVRSLGAAHTAISYDGITLNDAQTGQIDISKFSLDNVKMLSIFNGQSDNIFQPARQFSSAALVDIQTAKPFFTTGHVLSGKATLQAGSFALFNPALLINIKLTDQLALSNFVEWMSADGAYPYVLHYGASGIDSTSTEKRQNSDVQNLHIESTLIGSDSLQSGNLKLYYYGSERGLPGATIFYNTQNFSSQRIWDETFFVQGQYKRILNRSFSFQSHLKYNLGHLKYVDPMIHNSEGKEVSIYTQQEGYLSAGILYNCIPELSFSLNTDGSITHLEGNTLSGVQPSRYNWQTALAGKYMNNYLTVIASLLSTATHDQVKQGTAAKDYFKLSPYVGISVRPHFNIPLNLNIRAFYKNIFRLPTFNDLYYGQVGNRALKPENTNQFNIGLTYSQQIARFLPLVTLSVDGYHNSVANKIVAYPSKNLFTWTMLNYGKVNIDGIDASLELQIAPASGYLLVLNTTYSYQRALNVTSPTSREYKHQIPYTPRISGAGSATLQLPWLSLSYSIIWSGHRYAVNQNYAENRLPGYTDQSLSVSHTFKIKQSALGVKLACLNLANKTYSVVRYFPMPGRNWRATLSYQF